MKIIRIISFVACVFFALMALVNIALYNDSGFPSVMELNIGSTTVYEVVYTHPWGSALAVGDAQDADKSFAWELATLKYLSGLKKIIFINVLLSLICLVFGLYVGKFDISKKK